MYTEKCEIGETCWYIEDGRGNRIIGQIKCIGRSRVLEQEESETWQSDALEPLLATVDRRDSIRLSVISLINSTEPNPALRSIIESDRTFQKRI